MTEAFLDSLGPIKKKSKPYNESLIQKKHSHQKLDDYGFEVKVLQKIGEQAGSMDEEVQYRPLRMINSPTGNYVVAGKGQAFIIELRAAMDDVFGARLWIDGQEIIYKKTFKKRGFFMGFKLGEGRFRSFVFDIPDLMEEKKKNPLEELKDLGEGRKSEIRVEFYKTRSKLVSQGEILKKTIRKGEDQYEPLKVKENKKFFRKSLAIRPGEVTARPFLDHKKLLRKMLDHKTKMYKENIILYESSLGSIVINYGDFHALQILGVLSLSNYEHLPSIPLNEIEHNKELIERILITIIRKKEPISIPDILEEFKTIYKISFEHLGTGDISSFISHRNKLFVHDEELRLKCNEKAKNIFLDIRDLDPKMNIIPTGYYQTQTERIVLEDRCMLNASLKQSQRDQNIKNFSENQKSRNQKPVFIDLTDD